MTEETPLLRNNDTRDPPPAGIDKPEPPSFNYLSEFSSLAIQTLPIALSFGLQNAVQAWSVLMVGTLGTFELAVASYGYMFASCTGSMVAIGGATALDTLCSQAYTSASRASNPQILGHYLQRGLLILSALFVVAIAPLWWFSSHLFLALGQEHDFAVATGWFLRVLIPGGLLQVIAECLKKFLQVQGKGDQVGWVVAGASAVGVFMNYALLQLAHTGLWGGPAANAVYQFSTVLFLSIYILLTPDVRESWGGWNKSAFTGWIRFTNLAVTGILTVATEWWSFEIMAMMAAVLDPDSTAAQSILMASDLIFTTVPMGVSVAVSHRIGNRLGANDPHGAKRAARVPYIFALLVGSLEFIGIFSARNVFAYIFTDSKSVVAMTASILPLMAGFQILDIGNGGASGILRGAGKNHLAGVCNVVAYYGFGIWSAWFLCFRMGLGLYGLWLGMITGSVALLLLQTLCVVVLKWEQEAAKVSELEEVVE